MTLACLLGITMALSSPVGALSGALEEYEISETIESFRQLAVIDPDVAGAVWMGEDAYDAWHSTTNGLRGVDGGSFWLVHAFALVGSNAAPAPYAALYSPWLGALLVFGMDESAATLTTVGLEFASDAVESAADPMALAEALMASIRQGAAAFDAKAGAPEASEIEKSARSTLTARAKKYASTLRGAYDDSRTGRAVETTLLNLTEGDFLGPLSLLEGTDERWLASLTPVWFYSRSGTVVVLGSSYAPLDMIWIEFDDVASASISSVSLIRLFDRVVTREGGDT